MDIYRTLATLRQGRQESIYEYFERFNYYLDRCPNHGFQLHELMKFYLDGMSMGELRIMDVMVGGSIMDRTPTEVWYLIQDRAAETRPYTEYVKFSREEKARQEAAEARIREEEAYQLALARKAAAIASYKAELEAEMAELERKLEEITKNKREQQSAPEPHEFSSEDEDVTVSIIERVAEDTKDEELQVVPITSVEDVPTEESSTPQCSDLIIKQDTVITCNPIILPISDILVFPHVQNDTIQKALRNIQVWGSLEKVTIHIIMERTPMLIQKSEQYLASLCINWKTRKKDMRGSLGKVASHSHMARARKQTPKLVKLPNGLHKTWRRGKKGKRIFVNNKALLFFVQSQRSHSTFGWKPGWSSWRSVSHKVRSGVRKFDGVYPWAPNIR